MSISNHLARLEQLGYLEKKRHEGDRRIYMIYPTDEAKALFSKIALLAASINEIALRGTDSKQQQILVEVLGLMCDNLRSEEAQEPASSG